MSDGRRLLLIALGAMGMGVLSGLVGIGGGVLLVPMLVLLFQFDERKAQGTSLMALVPPTGLLAFLAYAHAHRVDYHVGLLTMPGIFLGGLLGSRLAEKVSADRLRKTFAVFILALGVWQIASAIRG